MRPVEVSYCGGPRPAPDYCDRTDNEWTVTQLGLALRDDAFPVLLLVAGWWLLWLRVLAWTRPGWQRLGDRVGRRLVR